MQVGDLVRCMTVDGKPVGLVVEQFMAFDSSVYIFYVLIPGYEDPFPIRTSQMELISESR